MTIDILLADDQDLLRAGFRLILEAEDDLRIVGEAKDGREAVDRARLLEADVVLMDIQMPVLDGISATRELTAGANSPKVLILTTFERDDYIVSSLRAGASGFLLKNAPPEDLIAGIRTVAGGEGILSPAVTRRLVERVCAQGMVERRDDLLAPLTGREREVLELVATGMTNQEIAERLFLSSTTVKSHVSQMLSKLDLRDRVQAVVFAYEAGVIQPGRRAAPADGPS